MIRSIWTVLKTDRNEGGTCLQQLQTSLIVQEVQNLKFFPFKV